jgi:hypothetical protein
VSGRCLEGLRATKGLGEAQWREQGRDFDCVVPRFLKRFATHSSCPTSKFQWPLIEVFSVAMLRSLCLVATLGAIGMTSAFSPSMSLNLRSGASRVDISSKRVGQIWTPTMMPEAPKGPDAPPKPSIPMPMVSVGEGQMDIYSRLAKDRILLLGTDVNDEVHHPSDLYCTSTVGVHDFFEDIGLFRSFVPF